MEKRSILRLASGFFPETPDSSNGLRFKKAPGPKIQSMSEEKGRRGLDIICKISQIVQGHSPKCVMEMSDAWDRNARAQQWFEARGELTFSGATEIGAFALLYTRF
jgi:hypothetical protein